MAILFFAATVVSAWGQTELIQNGSFESGSGTNIPGWSVSGTSAIGTFAPPKYPHLGSQFLNLGGPTPGTGYLSQTITIPAAPTTVVMFSFWVNFYSPTALPHTTLDYMYAEIVPSMAPAVQLYAFYNSADGYVKTTYDLSAYKGQSVQIYFSSFAASNDTEFFNIDDVSVTVTVPPPAITNVSPNPMEPVNAFQTLTITGSNFLSGDTLTFVPPEGGTIASVPGKLTFNSSKQLTYQLNNALDSGAWSVMVNSADNTLHSAATNFTVSFPPAVTQITPNPMPPKNGGVQLDLKGSNFFNHDTVTLISPDGIRQTNTDTSVDGGTNLFITVNNTNDSGNWTVIVNSADKLVHSSPAIFEVSYITPSIFSVSPVTMAPINGFQPFGISGSGFQTGMTLSFVSPNGEMLSNRVVSNFTVVSSTMATCLFNNLGEVGTWTCTAHSPDYVSQSSASSFKVITRVPKILSPHFTSTNLTLLAITQFGIDYILEYKTSSSGTNWIPVLTNTGTGGGISFTNTFSSDPQRFYRLLLRPNQ